MKYKPDNLYEFNKLHLKMIRSIAPIIISKKKEEKKINICFVHTIMN